MQHSIVILSGAITNYKQGTQCHTLLIQCYYILHWELVVIIIAISPCLRTRCRKYAHLSIKFSDDSGYQYFTSTMTCNHKNNCYFFVVLLYGICFDSHPYGDIKCILRWWLYLCIFHVRVLNFKSDLLYVSKFTVDRWYPLPPYTI